MGFSNAKGWVYGYKLHMSCSVGKLIVPLTAFISTANVHDSQMFNYLIGPLARIIKNILADPAYDNFKLYQSSDNRGLRLIAPIKIYPSTPPERIKLANFYNSDKGQELYADRKISIEPLFQIIKDTFNMDRLSVKGFENVESSVLICVLVYQLTVYYNCATKAENPRIVKRMLCC